MKERKYTLVDVDGNAFAIMAYVRSDMMREGKSNAEIDNYVKDAEYSENHSV